MDFQEHVFIKVPKTHLNLARSVVKDFQYFCTDGFVVSWTPTWLDPEPTGLPGANLAVGIHSQGRVPAQVPGVSIGGIHKANASGYKKPKVLGVLACGTASARPLGVTQRGALD